MTLFFSPFLLLPNLRFLLSGNLHGGSVVASYPYDDSPTHKPTGVYSKSADDEVFKYLAKAYASHHPIMRTGKPNCPGEEGETFQDGITNGAQWYDVEGKLWWRIALTECLTQIVSCSHWELDIQTHGDYHRGKDGG